MALSILVLTGASGSGKTSLVSALADTGISNITCINCDRYVLPNGSPEGAQLDHWISQIRLKPEIELAVLDTQIRPHLALKILNRLGIVFFSVVLVDCNYDQRNARLRDLRGQPELANAQMDCWAAYLRGQADALNLPIINTTTSPVDRSVTELVCMVKVLLDKSKTPR